MQNVTDAPVRQRRLKAKLTTVDGMGVDHKCAQLPLRLLKLAAAAGVEVISDFDALPAETGGGVFIQRHSTLLPEDFGPVIMLGLRVIDELGENRPSAVLAHEVAHALDPVFGKARERFANALGPMLLQRRISTLRGVRPLIDEVTRATYGISEGRPNRLVRSAPATD